MKRLDSVASGLGSGVAGSCKHGNEPSGTIKDWEFLAQLSDYQLLNEDDSALLAN